MTLENKARDFVTAMHVNMAKSMLEDACRSGAVSPEFAFNNAYRDGFVVGATLVMGNMHQSRVEELARMTRFFGERDSLQDLLNGIAEDHWAQLQASPGVGGEHRAEPLFREGFLLGAKTAFYTAEPVKKVIKKALGLKWWQSLPPLPKGQ